MGRQGREIKSNVTDNESALMITSHGTIQGYNGQALVDSKDQVIIHAEAFGESQDLHLIPAVLEGAKENMGAIGCGEDSFEGKILTADSNYHTVQRIWGSVSKRGWMHIFRISGLDAGIQGFMMSTGRDTLAGID
jgi:hypothetical protein